MRKTKTLTLKGIQFSTGTGAPIPHSDSAMFNAPFITLTFFDQKNGVKFDRITQQRTSDPVMCPVRQAASLVRRIRKINGITEDTLICAYEFDSKIFHVSQSSLLS